LLQASATVLYFNIPADYFRSLDRHYLPVLTTFAAAIALGTGVAFRFLASFWKRNPILVGVGAAAMLVLPAVQLVGNWSANDASRRYFTRDYALNALLGLPENAFYFTVGDNDTFPIMYAQAVEGVGELVHILLAARMQRAAVGGHRERERGQRRGRARRAHEQIAGGGVQQLRDRANVARDEARHFDLLLAAE